MRDRESTLPATRPASGQNRSNAVMATRRDTAHAALDDFPTPPWATRVFVQRVLEQALGADTRACQCWEPAANRGHMVKVLRERFGTVHGSDVKDYGAGFGRFDFLGLGDGLPLAQDAPFDPGDIDWIITNPPFKDLVDWIEIAAKVAKRGFALFCRMQVLESADRYERVYDRFAGHLLYAQYVERVALVEGRLDRHASTATAYGWLVYDRTQTFRTQGVRFFDPVPVLMIPPSRARFDFDSDWPAQDVLPEGLFKPALPAADPAGLSAKADGSTSAAAPSEGDQP